MARTPIARSEPPAADAVPIATVQVRQPEGTPTDAELAIRGLNAMAAKARTSLPDFYDFVMKNETTKDPLTAAPHQRLMFDFMEAHDRTVIRMPVGCGKTFSMAAYALFLLGQDVTQRGAALSKIQKQASKVVGMIADYIVEPSLSARLTMVFPHLQKSQRASDKWTANQISVDRPPGIRDASVVALGVLSSAAGARLSWIAADDTIDAENTNTEQARAEVNGRFDSKHISRLDPQGSRVAVMNTPWHRDDLTYHLEGSGWPTLTMDIYGFIQITNANAGWLADAEKHHVYESANRPGWYRMRAHAPDPGEETPLWPERYSSADISRIRYGRNGQGGMLPHEFARTYLCQPFDESAARCQREWIEKCKKLGLGLSLVSSYSGPNPTFTGLDLGIGTSNKSDLSVLFTFELWPNGMRRILNVESGRWDGATVVDKLIHTHDAYNSTVAVENNQAQDFIRQWALKKRPDLQVHAHNTQMQNKRAIDFGVESLFNEFQNGAWIIPCDRDGRVHPELQKVIDASMFYQPPPAHTPDHLMAMWIARERARKGQHGDPKGNTGRRRAALNTGGF